MHSTVRKVQGFEKIFIASNNWKELQKKLTMLAKLTSAFQTKM